MDENKLAKKVWDYLLLHAPLEKADCILVLGSHDTRVAEYGAQLVLEKWAPFIIFSGGKGKITKTWSTTEAEKFSQIAISMGVPREQILIEDQSSNTGENILFTKQLLEEKGISVQKYILVHKPYMERRVYATFKKILPKTDVVVTSPPFSFETYTTKKHEREKMINIMVGDLQRIKIYPKLGFQIPQEIPDDVWSAYETLVSLGYTEHILEETGAEYFADQII